MSIVDFFIVLFFIGGCSLITVWVITDAKNEILKELRKDKKE